MQAQQFQNIRNNVKIGRVIAVGTPYEGDLTLKGLRTMRGRRIPYSFIETIPAGVQLKPALAKKALGKLLAEEKHSLIISDVGEPPRLCQFEELALFAKEANPTSSFALLTSKLDCIGAQSAIERFIESRNFDPSLILRNVDYIIRYVSGDLRVFPLLINMHKDRLNYKISQERIMLVAEDKPNYYTDFLISLGEINKRRARILLARNLEETEKIIKECGSRLAGAIIDMEFPIRGHPSEEAGLQALSLLRKSEPQVPVILTSAETERVKKAVQDGRALALHKDDAFFMRTLREFINDFFGFGPFIFRLPDGMEAARAENLGQFIENIKKVPDDCIIYHAMHNHFSNWLYLHGYKRASAKIRPIIADDAGFIRSAIIEVCEPYLRV